MSETTLKARLVHPCKTDAEWASSNPVAKKGEIMISSDKSGMFKVGNGTSKWSELGYNHVTWANVEGKPSTFSPSAHKHTKSDITDFPSVMKNPNALTIKTNGTSQAVYDGGVAKEVNITASSIGLGNVNNTADKDKSVRYAESAGTADYATKIQTYRYNSTTETYGNQYPLFAQWDSTGNILNLICTGYTVKTDYATTAGSVDWANVNGKPSSYTPSSHTHTKSQITDFPTSMPASDVYAWAKAASKPSYSWNEITGKPSTFTPSSHSHANITSSGRKDPVVSGTTPNDSSTEVTLSGLSMSEFYGINTPCTYGNVINVRGSNSGAGELVLEWSGSDNTTGRLYYRSHRDTKSGGWGAWKTVAYTSDIPSTIAWDKVTGKPSTYPATAHTHDDRYYTESEIDGKLAKYLSKSGGTMDGTAFICWPDTGNWSNSNTGVTFPVSRGGLQWSGQSDGIQLYAVETGNDNLELYLKFLDDNSNGLSIRNAKGNETARISASGVISASSFIGTLTGDITGHAYAVRDYNNSKNIIRIGYSGDGLTTANLSHIAGYTDNGTKIKDVSKDTLKSWIGLGSAAYTSSDSYAMKSHTHDDRYYTETEINDKVTALNNSIATKVTEKTINTATDFNTLTTTGIYHVVVSTSSNLHAPTTNHGTLIVDFSVGTPYQIWIPDNNMTAQYKRTYSSSTWSGWTTQKLTDTVYTHPSYTAYSSGLYKITTNSLGHVTSATAVTKGDITALGIPGSNTDSKVLQTAVKASDYTNWRTVLWGASNSSTEGFAPTTVTDSVFSSQTLTFQPSTGTLKANTFKGNLSGNATSASAVAWSGITGKPSTYAPSSHTHTKSQITDFPTLGTAASKNTRTLTSVGHSSWANASTDRGYVPDMAFIAYWNGAYSSNGASNLAYCNRGAFGTIVTKNAGDYATAGHTHSYAGSSSVGGSANSAVKLATARNIKVGGLSNFSFNFDGSGNISVDNWGYGTNKYVTTNSASAPFFRIAYTETKNSYTDASMILMIDGGNTGGGFGILKVAFRSDNISTAGHSYVELLWLVRKNFGLDQFFVKGYNPANETQYVDLYFKALGTYEGIVVTALSMGARGSKSRSWTFDSGNPRSAADIRKYSYITTSSDAGAVKTCTGNASTATKLATARSINGTNFDGSGNITTANWGTTRTITIGNTGKSVNGSGNVSWSLSEIGAAAASHTHNYAGSSSAGGSATSAVKLDTTTAGSATQPVYFSGGKPVACTYTLGKSVPSNAVFTDTNTWRPLGTTADTACAGNDSRLSNSRPASDVYSWAKASSKPSYSWSEITGKPSTFTPSSHTHSYLPLSGGSLSGNISFSNNTGITGLMAGGSDGWGIVGSGTDDAGRLKIYVSDNGTSDWIDFEFRDYTGTIYTPLQMTGNRIIANCTIEGNISGSAGSVAWGNVTGKPSTYTPSSHTHTKSQITDFPSTMANPHSITIKLNGGSTEGSNLFTYNGSSAKSLNITASSIGAASSGHTHSGYASSNHTHSYLPLSGGTVTGNTTFNNGVTIKEAGLELYYTTPYIDFHFNNDSGDQTSRIIELKKGVLNVNGTCCTNDGSLWCTSFSTDGGGTFGGGVNARLESTFSSGNYTDPLPGISCGIKVSGIATATRFYVRGRSGTWLSSAQPGGAGFECVNDTIDSALIPGWRIRNLSGAWVGASYNMDKAFHLYYAKAERLSGNTDNGTDADFIFNGRTGNFSAKSITQTSDERRKSVISSSILDIYKDFFMKIKPFSFKWKDGQDDTATHLGVGAQSVFHTALECGFEESDIGLVQRGKEYPGTSIPWSVSYTEFIPLNIAVTQDHETRIEKLERENEELKQQIKELKGLTA